MNSRPYRSGRSWGGGSCGGGDVRAMKAAGREASAVTIDRTQRGGDLGLGAGRGMLFKIATAIEASKRVDVVLANKTGRSRASLT